MGRKSRAFEAGMLFLSFFTLFFCVLPLRVPWHQFSGLWIELRKGNKKLGSQKCLMKGGNFAFCTKQIFSIAARKLSSWWRQLNFHSYWRCLLCFLRPPRLLNLLWHNWWRSKDAPGQLPSVENLWIVPDATIQIKSVTFITFPVSNFQRQFFLD